MKKRDLLNEVFEKILTPDEADKMTNYYLGNLTVKDLPVHEMLSFSVKEWTAYIHGAPIDVIAEWRVNGWPNQCFVCKKEIISDDYGWFPREHMGKYGLRHIVCPETNTPKI